MAEETVTTTETQTQQPATSTIADLAAKGDVRGFMEAREAHLRGDRQEATTDPPPASEEKPEAAETETGTEPTAEEAAEAARASEAGKALAETKSRRARRRQSIQDEIDDLSRRRGDLRRDVETDEAKLVALRQEMARLGTKPAEAAPAADDPEPTPEQFDTYEKYVRAAGRWEARQEARRVQQEIDRKLADERAVRERDASDRSQRAVLAEHHARVAAARAAHQDYDKVIAAQSDLRVPQPLYEAIPFSPVGAEVMYHLAKNPDVADALMESPISAPMRDAIMDSTATLAPKLLSFLASNPDECMRLASLPPRAALKEMGKLEARLDVATSGPTLAAAPVTKAPKPIKPVGSSATATTVSLRDLATQDRGREFIERRDREERERLRRRA